MTYSFKCALTFKHKMRDPIYGFIPLTDLERDIIDTPIFQRLRRIHQLALTKYVYPSAEHSRFVHSIGVMHCASLIYEGVFNHSYTTPSDLLKPNPEKLQILRLAALLHDVGHLPFSHAAEKTLLPETKSHEDLSNLIIKDYTPIADLIRKTGIAPEKVASLLDKTPTSEMRVEHDIISGNLDADRADYLLRDSHVCGVSYGEYDFARFLQMFAAILDETDHRYTIGVGENDLWLAESLLISRYHYNLQVPYHRTRSGYDIALQNFLREIDLPKVIDSASDGSIKIDYAIFENFDDHSVFERAKSSKSEWAKYMFRQDHLHPLLDTTSLRGGGEGDYRVAIEKLESRGFKPDIDFFTQAKEIQIIKGGSNYNEFSESEDDLTSSNYDYEVMQFEDSNEDFEHLSDPANFKLPFGGINLIQRGGQPVDICEHSWIFKQFNDNPLQIYRIYVKTGSKDRCETALMGEKL